MRVLLVVAASAVLPAGCFRSRMLTGGKACPPGMPGCPAAQQPGSDGGIPGPDAKADAKHDLAVEPRDGKLDQLPGLRDAGNDGPRDGATADRADGRLDSAGDGKRDGAVDAYLCLASELCDNGKDDDCNGFADCFDRACQATPGCIDRKQETCNNGSDDDGNGLVDCQDPACFGDQACATPGREVCNNALDDDDDGLVDCADTDCAKDASCVVTPGDEICDNGKDDNGDRLVDCTDPKCKGFAACLRAACVADVEFGAIATSGSTVTRTLATTGATASFATCAPPGGVARVGSFSLTADSDLKLDFTQPAGAAHAVSLFRAGVGQACDQNLVECLVVGDQPSAAKTYHALPAGSYWLVVQSFPGTTGATTVTLSTGSSGTTETCDNGIDDDRDGATDCSDLDCAVAANCTRCVPDISVGTLVVGGASKSATVDTTTGSNRYHPAIAGLSTGNDIVVQFSLKETAGLSMQTWQTSGDHVYGIFRMPAPGARCDAAEKASTDLQGRSYLLTDWTFFPPGEYLLIFKARATGMEGKLSITLRAFANRPDEMCDNGIDDDDDQLADCDDPDCHALPSCAAQMCAPDGDLGDLDVGTRVNLRVDLTSATRTYRADCSRGDGRGRAYRVNILRPMTLDFSCTQTGDQVIAIASQTSPLDACDAHVSDCADPTIGMIGCNFGVPDIQPGVHYIIVQAFASGDEGTMNLTLLGEQQRTDEICNNGIDDDQDGAVDCNDRKCATDTTCKNLRCVPKPDLGLLPLDGSSQSTVVQTTGAGDDQVTSQCVSTAGGADSVVGFELPGTSDLTIEWAQAGNHALVLYQADSLPLPCEAHRLVDCKATTGAATGTYTLPSLAAGKYFLVVDADRADSEGGVILQLSGARPR